MRVDSTKGVEYTPKPRVDTKAAPTKQVEQPTNAVSKKYEISSDPQLTILKFSDERTKEVVMQIPSEVSIKIYKQVNEFLRNR